LSVLGFRLSRPPNAQAPQQPITDNRQRAKAQYSSLHVRRDFNEVAKRYGDVSVIEHLNLDVNDTS